MPSELKSYDCEIKGRNLVSAGAGTGKTYNIQILVLREILTGIPIDEILVVTFTNLATNELKERLRKVLQNAYTACKTLCENPGQLQKMRQDYDQVMPCLVNENIQSLQETDLKQLSAYQALLFKALQDFDIAAVSTIHGFCSNMLRNNAFESGIRYGLEIRESCQALVKSLAAQFIREYLDTDKYCTYEPKLRAILLKLMGMTPDTLVDSLHNLLANPDVYADWSINDTYINVATMPEKLTSFQQKLFLLFANNRAEQLCQELDKMPYLSAAFKRFWNLENLNTLYDLKDYVLIKAYPQAVAIIDDSKTALKPLSLKSRAAMNEKAQDSLRQLFKDYRVLAEGMRLACPVPESMGGTIEMQEGEIYTMKTASHNDSLAYALSLYKQAFLQNAYRYICEQLKIEKEVNGFITYDDLLIQLKQKLTCGDQLKKIIRNKYKCVLIDEFQDTDANQNAIFSAVFKDDNAQMPIFMIGDEKQAIYQFRGGDVESFMSQANGATQYTLTKNFRSSKDFIEALNVMRKREENPETKENYFFAPANIAFPEIIPNANSNKCMMDENGNNLVGESILDIKTPMGDETPIEVVAKEIAEFLGKRYKKEDGQPFSFKDIAILMRSTYYADELRDQLRQLGIPSVLLKGQNIFTQIEATWLRFFLDAVLNPGNQAKALRLITSPLFGFAPDLTEQIRQNGLAQFQMYLKELNEKWQKGSFHAVFHQFFHNELGKMFGVNTLDATLSTATPASRLGISAEEGERSISLLLQLTQYVANAAVQGHLGQQGTFDFLDSKIHSVQEKEKSWNNKEEINSVDEGEKDDDEYPILLTTQDDAVQILTIHKSKGLQFPVVFIPSFTTSVKPTYIYHSSDHTRIVNVNETDTEARKACDNEREAEAKRLLYVAVTRAIYACHFVSKVTVGDPVIDNTGITKYVYDLTKNQGKTELQLIGDLFGYTEKPAIATTTHATVEELRRQITELKAELNKDRNTQELEAENFNVLSSEMKGGWGPTSFSSISKGKRHEEAPEGNKPEPKEDEAPDTYDDDVEEDDENNTLYTTPLPPLPLIPYEERKQLFRFPGGKRTGTCWHAIMENLDFQQWSDASNIPEDSWAQVIHQLEAGGQLGNPKLPEHDQRLNDFRLMLPALVKRPLQFSEPFCLAEIPADHTLREFNFTYKIKEGISAEEIREQLAKVIEVPDTWGHALGRQTITGSIDCLLQNPQNGKFYILDWKTNMIGGTIDNFTADGVSQEVLRHFYSLQCVLYELAFIQYYRQRFHSVELSQVTDPDEKKALMRKYCLEAKEQFGGSADIFLRGITSPDHECLSYVNTTPELITFLDERIGVTF